MRFYCGLHQIADVGRLWASGVPAFVSVNRLRDRRSSFAAGDWIMDSGAFTEITTHGRYRCAPIEYAAQIRRWAGNGNLLIAVAQDWMCEPHVLARTGLTVAEHQRLTIERYDALIACDTGGVPIMPVLQGWEPADYVRHIEMYGDRLKPGAWVGVGSVCKRNAKVGVIEEILLAIKRARPDLRRHAFGLKRTALESDLVRSLLYSADSMAWSWAARREGRNANDWREALAFAEALQRPPRQRGLFVYEEVAA